MEISNKVNEVSRALFIDDWQSKTCHQHQNKAENCYQTAKILTNAVLNRTGALTCCWLLHMLHICFVLNHTYNFTVNNVPLTADTGSACDISPSLYFSFYNLFTANVMILVFLQTPLKNMDDLQACRKIQAMI